MSRVRTRLEQYKAEIEEKINNGFVGFEEV